jgi:DNA-binding IclR family transcriptional regulator
MENHELSVRDVVWVEILSQLSDRGFVRVRDADMSANRKRTMHRVLDTFGEVGWLAKEQRSERWVMTDEFAKLAFQASSHKFSDRV